MIQGGDPTGTGKGGQSIWGKPFADEVRSTLKVSSKACHSEYFYAHADISLMGVVWWPWLMQDQTQIKLNSSLLIPNKAIWTESTPYSESK